MIRSPFLWALAALLLSNIGTPAQEPPKTGSNVVVDDKGRKRFFFDHNKTKARRANRELKYLNAAALPPVTLPIDYAKDFAFPMYGNDTDGDCYYASVCHHDGTHTGMNGNLFLYKTPAILSRYHTLSGGDNGLDDQTIQNEWLKHGLADQPAAKIVDYLYVKITSPADVQAAIYYFGGLQFTLAVPNRWINSSDTGAVWDAPATPNQKNGHAVHFNGVDANGRCKLQTWGSYVWITPAGINSCDPSGWCVFSVRWFNAKGYAPNGKHITELASLWTQAGGKAIPSSVISSFPPPSVDPTPTPTPTPGPTPITAGKITIAIPGRAVEEWAIVPAGSKVITPEVQKFFRDLLLDPVPTPAKKQVRRAVETMPALLVVHVPEDATIQIDGNPTSSVGSLRRFNTPPLEKGSSYVYKIFAEWIEDGRICRRTVNAQVEAGEISEVTIQAGRPLLAGR